MPAASHRRADKSTRRGLTRVCSRVDGSREVPPIEVGPCVSRGHGIVLAPSLSDALLSGATNYQLTNRALRRILAERVN